MGWGGCWPTAAWEGDPWMQVMVTRARGAHAPSPSSGAAATSTPTSTATTPASSCPAGGSSTSGDWPRGADSGPAFNLVTVSECVPGEGSDWGISSGILTTLLPIKEHEIQIVFFNSGDSTSGFGASFRNSAEPACQFSYKAVDAVIQNCRRCCALACVGQLALK